MENKTLQNTHLLGARVRRKIDAKNSENPLKYSWTCVRNVSHNERTWLGYQENQIQI